MIKSLMATAKGDIPADEDMSKTAPNGRPLSFVIAKVYTPKRKDELHLTPGEEILVLHEKDDRCFVAVLDEQGAELERGWVPRFCMKTKDELERLKSDKGMDVYQT